jgi:hypothetical protein
LIQNIRFYMMGIPGLDAAVAAGNSMTDDIMIPSPSCYSASRAYTYLSALFCYVASSLS